MTARPCRLPRAASISSVASTPFTISATWRACCARRFACCGAAASSRSTICVRRSPTTWLYYAYLYSMGTGEPHAAGLVRGLARGRFIIGDKASVYAEIARSREPSNAAAELGLRRFAHGKPGRAPPSGGYDATAKLAQPAARVLDPHRILPYCVSRAQKQLSYLTAMVRAQQQERKHAARLTRGP